MNGSPTAAAKYEAPAPIVGTNPGALEGPGYGYPGHAPVGGYAYPGHAPGGAYPDGGYPGIGGYADGISGDGFVSNEEIITNNNINGQFFTLNANIANETGRTQTSFALFTGSRLDRFVD